MMKKTCFFFVFVFKKNFFSREQNIQNSLNPPPFFLLIFRGKKGGADNFFSPAFWLYHCCFSGPKFEKNNLFFSVCLVKNLGKYLSLWYYLHFSL
eukprot:NODE_4581_length_569_cov_6.071154_g3332_i0.p1 GENE.NODE_4581_length_569_cov_6.071154_g3332_i0~~NODE_4581_length_569_cov_6.071154_g3332_i0.p1  ORF type:complete len:95 (-),score=5.71 NODE_4581_length_569_cov_6.071154_g3332_i0:55-339(-)